MTDFRDRPVFVTGASGQFGRLVTAELLARGATNVTAGTRDPSQICRPAAPHGPQGRLRRPREPRCRLRTGSNGFSSCRPTALDGAGTRLRQHLAAVRRRSAPASDTSSTPRCRRRRADHPIFFAPDHLGTETAIRDSGIPFTILRNNWYFENSCLGIPVGDRVGRALHLGRVGRAGACRAGGPCGGGGRGAPVARPGSATYELSGPAAHDHRRAGRRLQRGARDEHPGRPSRRRDAAAGLTQAGTAGGTRRACRGG